jgi:alkylation response protein AidB-like acyl-CoA dehydrogenase
MYMNPLSVGRSFVAVNSITSAASALAIAIRYSAQRRQFSGPK